MDKKQIEKLTKDKKECEMTSDSGSVYSENEDGEKMKLQDYRSALTILIST